ncbi:DUF2076 domain-containing protein [Bosea sp. (in: a-proteobacteria)]|uniref:DUF2076 domain-containing protein n=1 Tax=Bosea sp. (in: a-proteobacteria) TaxID=1871050 RepID=UPI001AC9F4F1|nr:DUF2076 domain-containing protein [Bosea sp. (in: a-proteobacteria)]MBN9442259.1 DUF2076 domain-containing protein [Bosea sp. (in: a-proteobacteria)]
MTPQERDVIAGIFDRLRQAANQPRDPEAEAFIAERLREQPYAPYAMAQAVYVQEQALTNLHQQVESLQAQLRDLQSRASDAPAPSGGFLSGIFGGAPAQPRAGSVPPIPPRGDATPSSAWVNTQGGQSMQAAPPQPQPGPWSSQPQQSAGGGFMASALTTAAGVAGGMMLGNVLSHAFGGGSGGSSASTNSLASSVDSFGAGGNAQQAAYDRGASDQAAFDRGADDQARVDKAADTQDDGQNDYDQASYDSADYDDGGADDDSWV